MDIGNSSTPPLEDGTEPLDDFGWELGEVGDGFLVNFVALTLGVSKEDGFAAILVGFGFGIIVHGCCVITAIYGNKIP